MVLLRRIAHGAVAIGVAAAAVEHRAEPAPLLDQLTLLALRAGDAGRDGRVLLDVLAVWVAAASGERAEPAHALLQLLAAFGAELVEHLGLGTHAAVHVPDVLAVRVVRAADELAVAAELDLELARVPSLGGTERTFLVELLAEALERVLGLLQGALERPVELVQHLDLAQVALGDVVEFLLHVRGEGDVDHVGEVLDQLVGDHLAGVGGREALVLQRHVLPALDRVDDRGVGGRAADAQLLERLDQRRLAVAGRRLREVLFGQDLEHAQELVHGELGQHLLGVLVGALVPAFLIDADEPVEDHRLAGGAQSVGDVAGCFLLRGAGRDRRDVDAHLVEAGLGHLGRHRALPDQGVEAQLVTVEHAGHAAGSAHARWWAAPLRGPPARCATSSCSGGTPPARTPCRNRSSRVRRSRAGRCR